MSLRIFLPDATAPDTGKRISFLQTIFNVEDFYRRQTLLDEMKANRQWGKFWMAELDGILVGGTILGSRENASHLLRHGIVGVQPAYRRRHIGTALYTAQICQGILEGRRYVEDTIVPYRSPIMENYFLNSLHYQRIGILPERTVAFRDIHLWGKSLLEFDDWWARAPADTTYEIADSSYVQACLEKNMGFYRRHRPEVADAIAARQGWLFQQPNIIILHR